MEEERKSIKLVAVDIGGTKIRVALLNNKGHFISRAQYLTQANKGAKYVIGNLQRNIEDIIIKNGLEISEIRSISLAVAGAIDVKKGVLTSSPNLPGWHNIPLKDIIMQKFGVSTYITNDASAAAIGEYKFGAGSGAKNLVYLTVSTGIGGGIIIEGKLYLGRDGSAGELGHMIVNSNGPRCNCGQNGCLEALASGSAIARNAIDRIMAGQESILTSLCDNKIENITAEIVAAGAKCGDELSYAVINEAAYYLGIGLANIINIFNPEIIIIGGGLSKMGNMFISPAKKIAKKTAFDLPSRKVRIVKSKLGDYAGVLGVAYLSSMCLEH